MPTDRTKPILFALITSLAVVVAGCDASMDDDPADGPGAAEDPGAAFDPPDRPELLTDTLDIEGMPEPVELRLFEAPDGFPLPFSTYHTTDMAASADADEGTAHFVAEFGGVRNEDAFVHVYVFPPETPWQEAVATARGYEAGRGIPAGRNVEPIAEGLDEPSLEWAIESYRYRYQSGGQWYGGTVGVGMREARPFLILRHWPVEYVEGFNPRADFVTETWRWFDGTPLRATGP